MSQVWQREDLTPSEKLVLLAIADHADDSGYAWPGQTGIGRKCGIHRESVNRVIKRLKDKGLLTSEYRHDTDGRIIGSSYQIVGMPVTQDHTPLVTQDHIPSDVGSHKSSEEPSKKKHQVILSGFRPGERRVRANGQVLVADSEGVLRAAPD
jgi:hypothetical protein